MNTINTRIGIKQRYLLPLLIIVALGGIGVRFFVQTWLQNRRVAAVAANGNTVMPFDLDKTKHTFQTRNDGGIQTVAANNPTDTQQITLIQSHLRLEADKFRQGDFADPASLHGNTMPGLTELGAGASKIDITYSDLPDGGQIHYTSNDPTTVHALHSWFEAQISDHGEHASSK